MTDDSSDPAHSSFAVLAAIADLDEPTPAAIAKKVGIAYSTVNPKLRAWEDAGLAERFRHDNGQTRWRLTDAGRASTAALPQFAAADEPTSEVALNAAPTPASAADTAVPQPSSSTVPGHPSGDSGDDMPRVPAAPPSTAGSDTADAEPPTPGTPIVDVDLSGDGKAGKDNDAAAGNADPRPVDPVIAAATPAPAADETAEAAEDQSTDSGTATASTPPAKRRRPKGALPASALVILQDNPDSEYTIDQLRKVIDQADVDTGYPRASHGAVSNALDKLARDGKAVLVEERKAATFRVAPATG